MLNRRTVLKMLATLPFMGGIAGTSAIRKISGEKLARPSYSRDFFTELGVKPFINAWGTITAKSGSLMHPEVIEAYNYASQQFVDLNELQDKVGERIAEMLNCEAAMVTAGAASAMTLGAAACITGKEPEKIQMLPNLPGEQLEVIIQDTHRFGYDHAVRNTGVKMVEVNGPEEMEEAINEKTVMMLFFNAAGEHSVSREEFVEIGKRNSIPTFIDAAADVPPVENLFNYIEMGFDLVTFSGGKAIRGPQSTGLLYGRKDLIEAARLNTVPHSNTIGRGMKVNKEEILAMMVAIEKYLERDHDKDWKEWENRVSRIDDAVSTVESVETERYVFPVANHVPHLSIKWDQDTINITPPKMRENLENGYPSIVTFGEDESVEVSVFMMQPEEVGIVAKRLKEELEMAKV
ncbi:MAG: aminotransferase class V-fold PLP-dependent enzyme [Bacteroidetes bacterium]|nr:aminotransferase class V-fold PLP-dependent enzyme [Bacteroidota bacterium]